MAGTSQKRIWAISESARYRTRLIGPLSFFFLYYNKELKELKKLKELKTIGEEEMRRRVIRR